MSLPADCGVYVHPPPVPLVWWALPVVTAASLRNIHSDEPPPVKIATDADLSEDVTVEKEARHDLASSKAGRKTKLGEADKRSSTSRSRRERRNSKPPSPAPQTLTPPPEPEPIK